MDEDREAIRKLMEAVDIIDGSYAVIAKQLGETENALALLYALDDGGEYSQIEISKKWMIPKTTLNTIVREYVGKGWITLLSNAHTNEKYLRLTEAGQKHAAEVLQPVYAAELRAYRQTLQQFSSEFVSAFLAFAQNIRIEMSRPPHSNPS